MSELRRYQNGKLQNQKVMVLTNEDTLTIEIMLMRSPVWKDEHTLNFPDIDAYRAVEYNIFTVLRDKGFIYVRE